jgi:hypothetical protein
LISKIEAAVSDAAFLARLAEAIQVQHEATMRLQELASELIDHCSRMRSYTDRLHIMRAELAPPSEEEAAAVVTMDINRMPAVLRGGPRER